MIQPRPYQQEALNNVISAWKDGVTRQLISLPTGCGKTIIFGLVANALHTKCLVLAHREELLTQADQKIKLVYPNAQTGILQADRRDGLDSEICIASVQTATRRTEELAEKGYKLLICDEAHHAPSSSYINVFQELGFLEGTDKDKLLLGVTATAYRKDKIGLNNVFDKIVFERSILAMITAGYLCPPRALEVKTGTDISDVPTQNGEFSVGKLETKINTPARNKLVAETYLEYGEKRHGVVFCVTVDHALNVAQAFKKKGISCEAVYGDMPTDERRDVLARYENHQIQIITNCGVLTEGWDVPDTDIVMMARPTRSRGLYTQCVGRGLRLAPGKNDCLIIDFVDVSKKYDLCKFGELTGKELKPKEQTQEEKTKNFVDGYDEYNEQYTEGSAYFTPHVRQLELLAKSNFVWQQQGENYTLSLVDGSALFCLRVEGEKDAYTALYEAQNGDTQKISDGVLPLGYAMGSCEDFARRLSLGHLSLKDARWRTTPATQKQLSAIKSIGVKVKSGLTKGEAFDLINASQNTPATDKQKWFIVRYKLHQTPELLTKAQACRIIGNYKQRQAS